MIDTKTIGRRGEAIAGTYLEKAGYTIIAANYRSGRSEIDIIAQRNGWLIFFEIKTRFKHEADTDSIPLSAGQTKTLKRAIIDYCLKNRVRLERTRLDLIMILIDRATGLASLRHYPDIL